MSEKRNLRTAKMEQNMEHVLETWLANPLLSFQEIADKAGTSERTFRRYREDETFMANYDLRCRERFKSLQAKAMEQLEILMENGNWNATKYALDGNDYAGKQKLEINSTTIKVSVEEDGDA